MRQQCVTATGILKSPVLAHLARNARIIPGTTTIATGTRSTENTMTLWTTASVLQMVIVLHTSEVTITTENTAMMMKSGGITTITIHTIITTATTSTRGDKGTIVE